MTCGVDLFGNEIIEKNKLSDIFGVSPFSTLRANDGKWRAKKQQWINLGIKSEVGRDATTYDFEDWLNNKKAGSVKGMDKLRDTSIFDPVLCELMYKWFVPENGRILDPFAGGSVRGIVANKLGYEYHGIDIREEQIKSNEEQADKICIDGVRPKWYVGDSDEVLDTLKGQEFDAVFTCPPYVGLEKYSDLDGDISNMEYGDFIFSLESILRKCSKMLKFGGFLIVVVGEVRDRKGHFYGFVADTIKLLQKCKDLYYYNEAVLEVQLGSAAIRAMGNMKTKKLVKVHQNILIFKKEK